MYTINDLVLEIRALIDARIARREPVNPDWVTQEILNQHAQMDGPDSAFYRCVSRETVRTHVRQQINRFRVTPEKAQTIDRQLVLPGYQYLQQAYLIGADGEQIAMPLEQMSAAQRQAKIIELRAMGDGCHQHADELERYTAEHPALDALQAA